MKSLDTEEWEFIEVVLKGQESRNIMKPELNGILYQRIKHTDNLSFPIFELIMKIGKNFRLNSIRNEYDKFKNNTDN